MTQSWLNSFRGARDSIIALRRRRFELAALERAARDADSRYRLATDALAACALAAHEFESVSVAFARKRLSAIAEERTQRAKTIDEIAAQVEAESGDSAAALGEEPSRSEIERKKQRIETLVLRRRDLELRQSQLDEDLAKIHRELGMALIAERQDHPALARSYREVDSASGELSAFELRRAELTSDPIVPDRAAFVRAGVLICAAISVALLLVWWRL